MIFRFKATFDTLKGFMRTYELRGTNSLYDFHEHIVNDLNFAPDQVVMFKVLDAKGKIQKQYGLFDLGDGAMDEINIEKLMAQKNIALIYVFNIRDNRALRLTLLDIDEELPRKVYPRTSDEKGTPPGQFVDSQNAEAYDDDATEDMIDDDEINATFDGE